jgi:hypothetical protein
VLEASGLALDALWWRALLCKMLLGFRSRMHALRVNTRRFASTVVPVLLVVPWVLAVPLLRYPGRSCASGSLH